MENIIYTKADGSPYADFSSQADIGHCAVPYGQNIDGCSTIRPEFTRHDYELHRPHDAIPTRHEDVMWECLQAYQQTGPVRNIIDLMSDFSVAGITLSHPTPSHDKFYKNWFNRIEGARISERLANNLLIFGKFIARVEMVSLTSRLKKDLQKYSAQAKTVEPHSRKNKQIPGGYTALNPIMIDVLGGALSTLTNDEPIYGIRIPFMLQEAIKNPQGEEQKEFVRSLPDEYKNAKNQFIKLDQGTLRVVHYKKNDWEIWSTPIIYSILQDIKLLKKLKLTDFSVLDSAMDMVRLWTIGSIEHGISPNEGAFSKLSETLQATNAGGIRNIIWTDDIKLQESRFDGYDILGSEKYESTNNNIHAGLGVPPTLTGSASTAGSTNNLVSLKTLVERLVHVRVKIIEFWKNELEKVRIARGHKVAPTIEFDILNLGDEEAEKKIWLDLFDRNVISQEWLQVKFGADPLVEQSRQNREERERIAKKRVPRSTPGLHDPELDAKCKKSLVEQGKLKPETLNLTGVEDSDFIEATPENSSPTNNNDKDKVQNRNNGGRPPGSQDQSPRKRRSLKPIVRATNIWAKKAQDEISGLLNKVALGIFEKSNMRSLSSDEHAETEKLKCWTLFNLQPNSELTESNIYAAQVADPNISLYNSYLEYIKETEDIIGRNLTIEEKKELQREIYINTFLESEG